MNFKAFASAVSALALAGCASCPFCGPKDPVVGNWGLKLPFETMSAGHMIVTRTSEGAPEALVLWRWGSPTIMKSCKVEGNKFEIVHQWGYTIKGEVKGDKLSGTVFQKDGKVVGELNGWRNEAIDESVNTRDAKFGEPIDLLANGLDGWQTMNEKDRFCWSINKEDGVTVLSNRIGKNPDGSWTKGGANISSKRADFFDFNLEYDVRVPKNSNSGVYLRGRYEIQVIDSFGKPVDCHNMAAYYGRVTPSVAAEKPAGEWQHVSVTLYKKHLTVVLNGTVIIDNAPVVGITGGAQDAVETVAGPLYIQGDHSDADYRHMILRPVID